MTVTVKNALLRAARNLGIHEGVESYLSGGANEVGERDTALLLACFQTVENELALDYLPLTAEEELVTATGVIPYTELEKPAVRILCVENEWGDSVKYKLFPEYLSTVAGKVKVLYAYSPTPKTIEGVSEYQTDASERLFGYGIAAEYALTMGDVESAGIWDKKYKEAVQAAYRLRPIKRLRSRRWA